MYITVLSRCLEHATVVLFLMSVCFLRPLPVHLYEMRCPLQNLDMILFHYPRIHSAETTDVIILSAALNPRVESFAAPSTSGMRCLIPTRTLNPVFHVLLTSPHPPFLAYQTSAREAGVSR